MNLIPAIDLKDNKCVRLSEGKEDTSLIFNVTNVTAGINEQLSSSLMVYPNPFSQNTTINLLDHSRVKNISLFDPQGRKVKDFTHRVTSDKIEIEKGNLQNGIYLLIIETNNYVSKSKLIIK